MLIILVILLFVTVFRIQEAHPLKQGLKLIRLPAVSTCPPDSRGTSTKTRIETLHFAYNQELYILYYKEIKNLQKN